ncbi:MULTISPECIES: Na+/H+ antiporter NhaC family protein [unclassified Fibrobacter]|uniref:Na+/H+ antiporter NhaC family protein n=1 Tax=unclassified Fibrobacter TaxID=2634177 RepID=UPI00092247A1|nr:MULTISPECIES: Na+/H+ antiporter NhaC family protein [unclassified Fibrobacter]OWV04379.1 sodium:proton antiporter [Fibrobacter sp. UWH3]SHL73559.1 transporter, NhaC family [Fibrobacter sp. UWH6]
MKNESISLDHLENIKGNPKALLPIAIFLVLYLGLGITFEYVLKVPMGFYNIPIVAAFLIAIFVACIQNRKLNFDKKMNVMAGALGDRNIFLMILVFLCAGIFAGILGRSSASAAAYLLLDFIPSQFAVVVLFVVAAFVSTAMGTSVGTIAVVSPIAIEVAGAAGFSIPFCVASVIGGAMFGDNLSFISDTTIAATSTQGCKMKDKFKVNFWIALPAALAAIVIITAISFATDAHEVVSADYKLIQLMPYVLVLALALVGINVFMVLLVGIVAAAVVMVGSGELNFVGLLSHIGNGISGMYETIMVAVLVSALCGLIRIHGGFAALLDFIHKVFKGHRSGQLGVGLLVSAMDVATANNTVAIVMAAPIAKQMSDEYRISPQKTASLLDIFGCILQGLLPYGAQMLVALSAIASAATANTAAGAVVNGVEAVNVSAFDIIPYMFYPFLLLISVLAFIAISPKRKKNV